MIDKMKHIKDQFVELMEKDVSQRGAEGVNIKFHGEVADIIKDLSQAIYYCEVAKAMEGEKNEITSYSNQGYGKSYEYADLNASDPIVALREMMMTADPETKMRIRNELNRL